jgi:hypothetical protein
LELVFGIRRQQLALLIPSLIVEFERFWTPLLVKIDQPAETG